eukprot:TRINITY_DN34694_c0_g1_i1.p1 TRINITY_DN34694_c0_g1~~TRINITY_DN34694_c0_g1_i1.p1  ORF type:complete len:118 (+),score=16.59 TRINITY_DN34694_c0_g1_i1:40-393(+)
MARQKEFWRGRKEAEAKYRFRIRFQRPAGDGIWHSEKVTEWLRGRLGKDWCLYAEHMHLAWEGHGIYTYNVHLDDHTVIPDLLAFWQAQQLVPCYSPEIGRAVQQECRDRSRMPSSA